MTSFSGTVYPNGEITVGYSARKLQHSDVAVSRDRYSADEQFATKALEVHGFQACLDASGASAPLGSSSVPISHTRAPKGLKGLTSNARRMLRNGCYLIDQEFGRRRSGFGTATLPELSPSDYVEVHKNWGNITRTFMQWISRRLRSQNVNPMTLHVTEIQTERHANTGTAYLHLHYVYPCKPKTNYHWYIPASEMRMAWARTVSAFCSSVYDFAASIDTVVVKAPLGQYLSKYLSKGASSIKSALDDGLPVEAIGHWWGWSRSCRSAVAKRTIRAAGLAERIWRRLDYWVTRGWLTRVHFVYIPFRDRGDRCIGLVAQLSKSAMSVIRWTYDASRIGYT